MDFSHMDFIMLKEFPLYLVWWIFFFNHKRVLNFVKYIILINWDDHEIFIFRSIDVVYYTDCFSYVKASLHPMEKSHMFCCIILLMCYWIWFASVFFRTFASLFTRDIGFVAFFFSYCIIDFDTRVIVTSYNEFESVSSFSIFLKSLRRIGVTSPFNIW